MPEVYAQLRFPFLENIKEPRPDRKNIYHCTYYQS